MPRRGLLAIVVAVCAASGCASLQSAFTDESSDAPAKVVTLTPEASFNAGVLDMERGDDDAARRDWDRCLATSSADSPSRVDCMVALERLDSPASAEP